MNRNLRMTLRNQAKNAKKCLLCYKKCDEQDENGNVTAEENLGSETSLKRQISVILVLRKFLGVPKDICTKLLQHHGNPSSWIYWCFSCSIFVKEAEDTYKKLGILEQKFMMLQKQFKISIVQSQDGNNKKVNKRPAAVSRKYVYDSQKEPSEIIRSSVLHDAGNSLIVLQKIPEDSNEDNIIDLEKEDNIIDFIDLENEDTIIDLENEENIDLEDTCFSVDDNDAAECILPDILPENENISEPITVEIRECIKAANANQVPEEEKQIELIVLSPEPVVEVEVVECSNFEEVKSDNSPGEEDSLKDSTTNCQNKEVSVSGSQKRKIGKPNKSLSPQSETLKPVRRIEKPFSCAICGKCYSLRTYLKCHIKQHMKKPLHHCSICKKPFLRKKDSLKHELTHSAERAHKCTICSKSFLFAESLVLHQRIHTGKKRFWCKFCESSFSKKTELQNHWKSHSEKENLCTVCGRTFSSEERLNFHLDSHNRMDYGKKTDYCCSVCGKIFTNNSAWTQHQLTHIEGKRFKCNICDKRFGYALSLVEHERTHTGEKPFECSICKKRFTRDSALRNHIPVHDEKRQYLCSICGKSYKQSGALKRHQEEHTSKTVKRVDAKSGKVFEWPDVKWKRYACSFCGKPFYAKNDFVTHERTHTGEKPYSCNDCPKTFKTSAHLNIHRRRHNKVYPYSCPICDRKFISKSHLNQHAKTHSAARPFPCTKCDKTFRQKHGLQKHEKSHL